MCPKCKSERVTYNQTDNTLYCKECRTIHSDGHQKISCINVIPFTIITILMAIPIINIFILLITCARTKSYSLKNYLVSLFFGVYIIAIILLLLINYLKLDIKISFKYDVLGNEIVKEDNNDKSLEQSEIDYQPVYRLSLDSLHYLSNSYLSGEEVIVLIDKLIENEYSILLQTSIMKDNNDMLIRNYGRVLDCSYYNDNNEYMLRDEYYGDRLELITSYRKNNHDDNIIKTDNTDFKYEESVCYINRDSYFYCVFILNYKREKLGIVLIEKEINNIE